MATTWSANRCKRTNRISYDAEHGQLSTLIWASVHKEFGIGVSIGHVLCVDPQPEFGRLSQSKDIHSVSPHAAQWRMGHKTSQSLAPTITVSTMFFTARVRFEQMQCEEDFQFVVERTHRSFDMPSSAMQVMPGDIKELLFSSIFGSSFPIFSAS